MHIILSSLPDIWPENIHLVISLLAAPRLTSLRLPQLSAPASLGSSPAFVEEPSSKKRTLDIGTSQTNPLAYNLGLFVVPL